MHQAEDAFVTPIGRETIGIYSSAITRGPGTFDFVPQRQASAYLAMDF